MDGEYKYYKVTNNYTKAFHYCAVDKDNRVYFRNGMIQMFDQYKSKMCDGYGSVTITEVPKIVVINHKRRYILDQINVLRSRLNQIDYEDPKDLVLIGEYVKPLYETKK